MNNRLIAYELLLLLEELGKDYKHTTISCANHVAIEPIEKGVTWEIYFDVFDNNFEIDLRTRHGIRLARLEVKAYMRPFIVQTIHSYKG